jgi:hypothetical protein
MADKKDFSILKWIVFPSLTLALGGVVAWFNIKVFGIEDGLPYVIIVAVLVGFSIAINKYTSSKNVALARAAFVLEIVLSLALALNAAYSFSVQRDMSMARQSEQSRSEDLKTISGLKSRTAQRDATRMIASNSGEVKNAQQIFVDNEKPLFWIMIAELLAYIISAFTLLGISHLWKPKDEQTAQTTSEVQTEVFRPSQPEIFRSSQPVRSSRQPRIVRDVQPVNASSNRRVIGFGNGDKTSEVQNRTSEASEVFNGEVVDGAQLQQLRKFSGNFKISDGQSYLSLHSQASGIRVFEASNYLGHLSWNKWNELPKSYEMIRANVGRRS